MLWTAHANGRTENDGRENLKNPLCTSHQDLGQNISIGKLLTLLRKWAKKFNHFIWCDSAVKVGFITIFKTDPTYSGRVL